MKTLQLNQAWGRHAAGAELRVHERGMALDPDVVDPKRAETLLALGLAVEVKPPDAVESEAPPAKRRTKKARG